MLRFISKQMMNIYNTNGDNKKRWPEKECLITEPDDINIVYPPIESFHNNPNQLEAIVLLTTNYEIEKKRFNDFILNIIKTLNRNKKLNIDFIISINNNKSNPLTPHVLYLKYLFNNIKIINNDILPEDDIYKPNLDNVTKKVPTFGLSSGPNILFWNTMQELKEYNTVLVLETDCILYLGWLDKITRYIDNCGNFLISGPTYDGTLKIPSFHHLFFHINGVSLYKTGSPIFQFIIKKLIEYTKQQVSSGNIICSYDYMFIDMILTKLKNINSIHYDFWKLVYRNITKNQFIVNMSPQVDSSESESVILKKFPDCIILHKKIE